MLSVSDTCMMGGIEPRSALRAPRLVEIDLSAAQGQRACLGAIACGKRTMTWWPFRISIALTFGIFLVMLFPTTVSHAVPSFSVALYPTVAKDQVTIEIFNTHLAYGGIRSAGIYSTDGSLVQDLVDRINGKLTGQQTIVVDVHEYGSGAYFLSITTGGPIAVQKFVKVR